MGQQQVARGTKRRWVTDRVGQATREVFTLACFVDAGYGLPPHHAGLLECLAELFPHPIQIHYGQHQREQLVEAARRSRACAYLADDDHGSLAFQ